MMMMMSWAKKKKLTAGMHGVESFKIEIWDPKCTSAQVNVRNTDMWGIRGKVFFMLNPGKRRG